MHGVRQGGKAITRTVFTQVIIDLARRVTGNCLDVETEHSQCSRHRNAGDCIYLSMTLERTNLLRRTKDNDIPHSNHESRQLR